MVRGERFILDSQRFVFARDLCFECWQTFENYSLGKLPHEGMCCMVTFQIVLGK